MTALNISRELAEHAELVAVRRVLELGSGTGLCGILAAKLGATQARCVSQMMLQGPVIVAAAM